jgi:hypothetical protein
LEKKIIETMKENEFCDKVLDKYEKDKCPITNDITDRVFLMIENDAKLLDDYRAHAGGKNINVKNGGIAKAIKARFNLQNDRICRNPKNTLIKSYMMFKSK